MTMLFGRAPERRRLDVKTVERRFKEDFKPEELEKGDVPAMMIAALITFVPVMLIVIALMVGIPYLMFGPK